MCVRSTKEAAFPESTTVIRILVASTVFSPSRSLIEVSVIGVGGDRETDFFLINLDDIIDK